MKTLSIVIVVSLLVVVLTVTDVRLAIATEEFPYPLVSEISISSPLNATYSTTPTIMLNVTATALPGYTRILMSYNIDGSQEGSIPITETYNPHYGTITYANGTIKTAPSMFSRYLIDGYVTLADLSEGSHSITVYAEYDYPNNKVFDYQTVNRSITEDKQAITYFDSNTVHFTITNESSLIIQNMDETDMLNVPEFKNNDPTSIPIGTNLATNLSLQEKESTHTINIGIVAAITIAAGIVALSILAFKKTKNI